MSFQSFTIGDKIAQIPLVQGGMGVGVSLSGLAGAVAAEGGVGIISAAQIGYLEDNFYTNPIKANFAAIKKHLTAARVKAKGGIVGVNIMTATNHYEDYVRCCVENEADVIVSGAGLPANLPKLTAGSKTKIAPIISSLKGAQVLLKLWEKRYGATADMIVIEGPEAGGHLGFKKEEIIEKSRPMAMAEEIREIVAFIRALEERFKKKIPVVFGGGLSDRESIQAYMDLGLDGVQVATPFVATEECDAHPNFKDAYVKAKKEDIVIIQSPVGMPGRAIENDFTRRTKETKEPIEKCLACLSHCNPADTPYCITKALISAVRGDTENGLVFCGAKAYELKEITTVKKVLNNLMGE